MTPFRQTRSVVVAVVMAALAFAIPASAWAKTPGQTYCFHGICHRVLTVMETSRIVGRTETVVTSFYDDPKVDVGNPSLQTSSGERFDPRSDRSVASPIYPNGTRLLLWNPKTSAAAEVRVTNSGPYHGSRRLDVSPRIAERLGFKPLGVSQLLVTVLAAPSLEDAQYVKGRSYAPVGGYLGVFENQERARLATLLSRTENATASVAKPAPKTTQPTPSAQAAATSKGADPSKPLHTSSVGWNTTGQPIRPPLQRPTPAAKAAATAVPAPVTASKQAVAPLPATLAEPQPLPAARASWPPAANRATSPSDWAGTLNDSETSAARTPAAKSLGLRP